MKPVFFSNSNGKFKKNQKRPYMDTIVDKDKFWPFLVNTYTDKIIFDNKT